MFIEAFNITFHFVADSNNPIYILRLKKKSVILIRPETIAMLLFVHYIGQFYEIELIKMNKISSDKLFLKEAK